MASEQTIQVCVVFAPQPRTVQECILHLPQGVTLREAISQSQLLVGLDAAQVAALECGVWGRKQALQHVLRDGDRVEIYRALRVDPKEARRQRFAGQGAKTAGLFVKKRQGAKAGY
ncbi:MAG: RnfH family protein [Rhodoferax sp.]|nr:MAG: RnfH family protein [Rhodoferax sp.]